MHVTNFYDCHSIKLKFLLQFFHNSYLKQQFRIKYKTFEKLIMQASHPYNVCVVPYSTPIYDKVLSGHLLPYQH